MKVIVSTNPIQCLTILHLKGWIKALDVVLETDDCPFETTDELALQLDHWRSQFQKYANDAFIASQPVLIMTYGNNVILIANQATGDYLKIQTLPHSWSTETL